MITTLLFVTLKRQPAQSLPVRTTEARQTAEAAELTLRDRLRRQDQSQAAAILRAAALPAHRRLTVLIGPEQSQGGAILQTAALPAQRRPTVQTATAQLPRSRATTAAQLPRSQATMAAAQPLRSRAITAAQLPQGPATTAAILRIQQIRQRQPLTRAATVLRRQVMQVRH